MTYSTRWIGRVRRTLIVVGLILVMGGCTETPSFTPPSPHPSQTLSKTSTSPFVQRVAVPDIVGSKLVRAKLVLQARELRIRVQFRVTSDSQPGTILKTTPRARSLVDPGTRVVLVIAKAPPNPCLASTGNPWCYDFSPGSLIYWPPISFCSYFTCIGSFWDGHGYVIQCQDGEFSQSGGIQGSCSYHGGNYRPLYSH
jgi:hypothetical protein